MNPNTLQTVFHKPFFIMAHIAGSPDFCSTYRMVNRNQTRPLGELESDQGRQLAHMVRFSYDNIPFYRRLFQNLRLEPDSVRSVENLQKLPILTKETIISNWDDFRPIGLDKMRYSERSTGGTTGTPFTYRLGKPDRFLSGALLYRGWGYAGYELGDRMVFLGGSSLDIGARSILARRAHEFSRNVKKLSSFDMGEVEMRQYVRVVNSFKPKYIMGYPSSIYLMSKWIEENNLEVHRPTGVFTTSEKLHDEVRDRIETVFNCDVFDGYGLNDGGLSAFECQEHCGMHVDTERSVMEVVNEHGDQLDDGEGTITATTLHNFAMPLIRYDTGDVGKITTDVCSCGLKYRLLSEVIGRSVDTLITPEGKNVHGWFFLYIFWEFGEGVKEYQVIQEKLERVIIKIVPRENFDHRLLDRIVDAVRQRSKGWIVEFRIVDKIEKTPGGKNKFIVNNLKSGPPG